MKYVSVFFSILIICLFHATSCKEKSSSVATDSQSVSNATSESSDEIKSHETQSDSGSETLQAPMDAPIIKDPHCISKPSAKFYIDDPSIEKNPLPRLERPFLTYIPWVEKEGNIAKVYFIDYCTKDKICKYEKKYMYSSDLGDCTELSKPIVQKFLDKKPLAEILPNLSLYGSQFKTDGTSTVDEISIQSPGKSYPSDYFTSFRWDIKDTKLTLRIAMAEHDVCSPDPESGSEECGNFCGDEKDEFNALHNEDSEGDCMFIGHKRFICEITDIKLSDDRSKVIFNAKQLGADEEIPTDFCKADIRLIGNPVNPLKIQ